MSDKKYGSRGSDREDFFYERRAKKKAMRDDHKDRWRYTPTNKDISEGDEDEYEADDWEGYRAG